MDLLPNPFSLSTDFLKVKDFILTPGSDVGRLGGDDCSIPFWSWLFSGCPSLPCCLVMSFDPGLPLVREVSTLWCVGDAAEAAAASVLVLEGDASKRGGEFLPWLSGVEGTSSHMLPLTRTKPSVCRRERDIIRRSEEREDLRIYSNDIYF